MSKPRPQSYKPGQSGNPAGRPKGLIDRRRAVHELLLANAPDLVTKAVELALAGDSTALRICIDRVIPALRPVSAPVTLPGLSGSFAERGEAVVEAMRDGMVSADDAVTALQALNHAANLKVLDEFAERLKALERAQEARSGADTVLT